MKKAILAHGKLYAIEMNFLTLMNFEKISGKMYDGIKTYGDSLVMMYCMVLSAHKSCGVEFSDFVSGMTSAEYMENAKVCTAAILEFFEPGPGDEKKSPAAANP